jgi:hypothetical protein
MVAVLPDRFLSTEAFRPKHSSRPFSRVVSGLSAIRNIGRLADPGARLSVESSGMPVTRLGAQEALKRSAARRRSGLS